MTLFAIIVIEVLADREKSLEISADARVIQTVRYLAAAKMDDILREPDEYDENDSGTFDDIDEEADWQNFEAYSWELTIREVVVVGDRGDSESDFLFNEDEDQEFPTGDDGAAFAPRMVREVELTVRFEPDGVFRPDLSLKIRTFIPPEEAEETQ